MKNIKLIGLSLTLLLIGSYIIVPKTWCQNGAQEFKKMIRFLRIFVFVSNESICSKTFVTLNLSPRICKIRKYFSSSDILLLLLLLLFTIKCGLSVSKTFYKETKKGFQAFLNIIWRIQKEDFKHSISGSKHCILKRNFNCV